MGKTKKIGARPNCRINYDLDFNKTLYNVILTANATSNTTTDETSNTTTDETAKTVKSRFRYRDRVAIHPSRTRRVSCGHFLKENHIETGEYFT
jgi:hypothetical protein